MKLNYIKHKIANNILRVVLFVSRYKVTTRLCQVVTQSKIFLKIWDFSAIL